MQFVKLLSVAWYLFRFPVVYQLPAWVMLLLIEISVPVSSLAENGMNKSKYAFVNDDKNLNLLIVIDGLRPDYITEELMPNLYNMGREGVIGKRHSAAFPSNTRVNSPTIATGTYPASHGIMNNTMLMPEMGDEFFVTNSAENLQDAYEKTDGSLLTVPAIGEILDDHGFLYFVTSSASTGASYLLNHYGIGLGLWNTRDHKGQSGHFIPESARHEAKEHIGDIPVDLPGWTNWVFDSYKYQLGKFSKPDFTIMWIGEPDGRSHEYGVGAPETLEAVSHVDYQIGNLLKYLDKEELINRVNIFVTTDHGFSTTTNEFDLGKILAEYNLDGDVRISRKKIYLKKDDPILLEEIVEVLQRHEAIGNIYSSPARPGSSLGKIAGTLSTEAIRWNHERSADLLVSPAWTSDENEFGYNGTTTMGGGRAARHGSDSPYDVRIQLIASGPDIKKGIKSKVPTGNADFIPTILHLLEIDVPSYMEGRVMHELLEGGVQPQDVRVHEFTNTASVKFQDGFRYQSKINAMQVGSTFYIRGSETKRNQPNRN